MILAGKEYGTGSSRDWAAKGTMLLGVKAVIAESFERIHRSNLIGMGVLPLQFKEGDNAPELWGSPARKPSTSSDWIAARAKYGQRRSPRPKAARRSSSRRDCASTRRRSSTTTGTAASCTTCCGNSPLNARPPSPKHSCGTRPITRSRDWEGIFRGVENMDVFPAASMDGFTAARKIPSQSRLRSVKEPSSANNAPGRPRSVRIECPRIAQ